MPRKDIVKIKEKIKKKAEAELKLRISKGYTNINLELIEPIINELLSETNVTE